MIEFKNGVEENESFQKKLCYIIFSFQLFTTKFDWSPRNLDVIFLQFVIAGFVVV